jgi:hypothetical protein
MGYIIVTKDLTKARTETIDNINLGLHKLNKCMEFSRVDGLKCLGK